MAVFETTVAKGLGEGDWQQEVRLAPHGNVQRSRYQAPRTMMWDGVKGRPDAIGVGDLLCFVMSCYNTGFNCGREHAEMAVYRIAHLRGRGGGRASWIDRQTQALDLRLQGFVRRDRFAAALGRNAHAVVRGTAKCKGAAAAVVLSNLDFSVPGLGAAGVHTTGAGRAPTAPTAAPIGAATGTAAGAGTGAAAAAGVGAPQTGARAATAPEAADAATRALPSQQGFAAVFDPTTWGKSKQPTKRKLNFTSPVNSDDEQSSDDSEDDDGSDDDYSPYPKKRRAKVPTKLERAAADSHKITLYFPQTDSATVSESTPAGGRQDMDRSDIHTESMCQESTQTCADRQETKSTANSISQDEGHGMVQSTISTTESCIGYSTPTLPDISHDHRPGPSASKKARVSPVRQSAGPNATGGTDRYESDETAAFDSDDTTGFEDSLEAYGDDAGGEQTGLSSLPESLGDTVGIQTTPTTVEADGAMEQSGVEQPTIDVGEPSSLTPRSEEALHCAPSRITRRSTSAVPRAGTKVKVAFTTGSSEGIVTYTQGSKIWVAYPEMVDRPSDVRCTPWFCQNLRVLVKPGNPKSYRLSPARLRRLAVSGGMVDTRVPTTAYDATVWHEPIDWAVQQQRRSVTIVDAADSRIDSEDSGDEDESDDQLDDDADYSTSDNENSEDETAGAIHTRGVPITEDDPVLRHLKRLWPLHSREVDVINPQPRPPFCLFENVVRLASQEHGEAANNIAERPVCKELGLQVYSFDSGAAGLSEALRNRVYWSNIPPPTIECSRATLASTAITDLLRDKPPFDDREHLNCLTTKEGTNVYNRINDTVLAPHYQQCEARGQTRPWPHPPLTPKHWKEIKQNNLLFDKKKDGTWRLRPLHPSERCRLMGFPKDYCDHVTTTVAALHTGQSFHVPTIELLLAGIESPLRDAIQGGFLGSDEKPLVVVSFFDGIGAAWIALRRCLDKWGLADICVHYISIEVDEKCRRVMYDNFPKDIKPEHESPGEQQLVHAKGRYHLHQQKIGPDGKPRFTQWGDIRNTEKEIVHQGRHQKIYSSTGAMARLDEAFLVFNGFPCNNAAGLNQATGANGQQQSMEPGAAGPKTGLYYQSERILEKILRWRKQSQEPQQGDGGTNGSQVAVESDDCCEVSDQPFT